VPPGRPRARTTWAACAGRRAASGTSRLCSLPHAPGRPPELRGRQRRRNPQLRRDHRGQEKAKALKERFGEWVWEDPERADRLARVYNDAFNAIVLRSYDTDHMSLPGLVETWTPRPHQFAAVARMIAEPTVGLFHEVGAGKTAEMVMGVMEQRRLGLVNKPAIVVPNHMLGQFSREFLQLYPQARILAAGTADLVESKRRAFVARATTGNWDAIIMTRTAFEKLPVGKATLEQYMSDQVNPLRKALTEIKASGENRTVKQSRRRSRPKRNGSRPSSTPSKIPV
jgi:N12 class adenine-specific DNA methylase